jgi:hypothetical protein
MAYLTETDRIKGYREHMIRQLNGVGCKPEHACETCRQIRRTDREGKQASRYRIFSTELDESEYK